MEISWSKNSVWTRRIRDRFTQARVITELDKTHSTNKFDFGDNLFVTFVIDNRYAVVWKHIENVIEIRALLACQYRDETLEGLKNKINKVLIAESHARQTLDSL